MRLFLPSTLAALAALAAAPAGATITPVNAGSTAFFGSQSTWVGSDPVGWTGPGPGVPAGTFPYYPVATPLAGVPLPPTSPPIAPVNTGTPNNFQVPGGYTYNFSDGVTPLANATNATTNIDQGFVPAGTQVLDAWITFPNWRFDQGLSAAGYAYEQVNFWSAYMVTTALTGGPATLPFFVSGSTSALGTAFVQFDAVITYTWYDINTAGVVNTPGTTLGTVTYSWWAPGGTTFTNQIVTPAGLLAATPAGSTAGLLELTGHAWIAGDPFSIQLSNALLPVPEPAASALLLAGLAGLGVRRAARRRPQPG